MMHFEIYCICRQNKWEMIRQIQLKGQVDYHFGRSLLIKPTGTILPFHQYERKRSPKFLSMGAWNNLQNSTGRRTIRRSGWSTSMQYWTRRFRVSSEALLVRFRWKSSLFTKMLIFAGVKWERCQICRYILWSVSIGSKAIPRNETDANGKEYQILLVGLGAPIIPNFMEQYHWVNHLYFV